MRVTRLALACLVGAAFVVTASAQEGHPLKGSWLGDFGPNKNDRTPVFVVMDWDGKALSGTLNPGTDNIPLKVTLNAPPPPPPPPAGGNRGGGGGGNRGGGGGGAAPAGGAPAAGAPAAGAAAPAAGGGRGAAPAAGGGAAAPPAGGAAAGGQGGGGNRGGGGGLGNQANLPAPPPAIPADWLVHIEYDGKDKSGAAVHFVVDGKIENLGLSNRSIVGTWNAGTTKNDFRLQRQ